MEWETDAARALSRVPFFVRKLARRRIEETVAAAGRSVVTLADARQARDGQMAKMSATARVSASQPSAAPDPAPSADPAETLAGLSEAEIRKIEALAEQQHHETRLFSVKGCGGAVGCPLALRDVRTMTEQVVATIAGSGLAETLAARITGPILSHHRFKVAVAGCPNSCSEPQIKDFALVAGSWPSLGDGDCTGCGECASVCREGAVSVVDLRPTFDEARCVGCGACAEVCPREAIVASRGWTVMVGGRLGRHPRLATTVAVGVSDEEALASLERYLDLLQREGRPGERLGQLLERLGMLT